VDTDLEEERRTNGVFDILSAEGLGFSEAIGRVIANHSQLQEATDK